MISCYTICVSCLSFVMLSADTPRSQRFAESAKIMDFSARDLYFPDSDRMRAILSAFINFIKFSEQNEGFLTRLREQSSALLKERQIVTEEIAELEDKMTKFK